jgi:Ala-tRNA(Pro) deacylase
MPVRRLTDFLDRNRVKYVRVSHSLAFTAQEIAASAHIPGKDLAKTVIVKLDGTMGMVVLAASRRIDFDRLRAASGAKQISLATEEEFKSRFPECEPGAMPPFGNLYDMKVYVDDSLSADEEIAFNAGSHTELVRMKYADFKRLAEPKSAAFTRPG